MHKLLFALTCAVQALADPPVKWSLLPASSSLTVDGTVFPLLHGSAHMDNTAFDLVLYADTELFVQFETHAVAWSNSGTAMLYAVLSVDGLPRAQHMQAHVERTRDVNGGQLLHVVVVPVDPALAAPDVPLGPGGPSILVDAWFVNTEADGAFIPFCGSDR
jgi:hypothetical protein